MWAIARYDLGLPEDEIGRLTPGEYDALLERKKQNDNRTQFHAGIIAAAIYNAAPFGGDDRKIMSPLDFVPEWKALQEKNEFDLRKLSPEAQRDYLLNTFSKRILRKR